MVAIGEGGHGLEGGLEAGHALHVEAAPDLLEGAVCGSLEGVQGVEGGLEVKLGASIYSYLPTLGHTGGSRLLGGMAGRVGLAWRPCQSCPVCSQSEENKEGRGARVL